MAITLNPEKLPEFANPTKTSSTEMHIALADAGLDYDNTSDYAIVGSTDPGSFDPNPTGTTLDIKGGTTSVTQSRHLQERDETVAINLREWTSTGARMANKSTLDVEFTDSSVVTNALTVEAGSGAKLLTVTGAQASLLTTGHYVYREVGPAGFTLKEERRVAKVVGNQVTLKAPFSSAPATDSLITVAAEIKVPRGGANLQEYTLRFKTTADNGDIHILHYPSAVVQEGKMNQGSNSQNMRPEFTFGINAQPQAVVDPVCGTINEPVFGNEYMIPCEV